MNYTVRGQPVKLDPRRAIGKGGEADIYRITGDIAAKIYKPPNHPDYLDQPIEQEGAAKRLEIHQTKLPALLRLALPPHVTAPVDLVLDSKGKIAGYTMRFIDNVTELWHYADVGYRATGVADEIVMQTFQNIHTIVSGLHRQAGITIGDFNDMNILVNGSEAHLIDIDSSQFDQFLCRAFTARFVDPLLIRETTKKEREENLGLSRIILAKPYTSHSDWYAFAVMLMASLLFVDPYGGVYIPKDPKQAVEHSARPLKRITVFDPQVRYPKKARPYKILPDELLNTFFQFFVKDWRGEFPLRELQTMRWTTCLSCGTVHARSVCPDCALAAPAAVKQVVEIRGNVTATRIFKTNGMILFAAIQNGKLRWLYHDNQAFKRENDYTILNGDVNPSMRFRINSEKTIIAMHSEAYTIGMDGAREQTIVDQFRNLPVFDANENHRYWLANGRLMKDGQFAAEFIGDVLQNQTLFWVGSAFGFGFYQAGSMSVAFTFDAERAGINDSVKLPPIKGQLIDSTCVFSKNRAWFFVSNKDGSQTVNQCVVISPNGEVEAVAQAEAGDGSWLGDIRGKCAAANFLLAATDEGIVRMEIQNGQILQSAIFPDTEPFVDSGCHLFAGTDGLYVVSRREIRRLVIR